MLTERLKRRIPSTRKVGTGVLNDYELRFHKRGADGSAKCSILEKNGNEVHGIIYDIDPAEKPDLDHIEGPGYRQKTVTLQSGSGTFSAYTYQALKSYRDNSLLPYFWYKSLVLEGAMEHRLPDWYIKNIRKVEAMPDPDSNRSHKELSIISKH